MQSKDSKDTIFADPVTVADIGDCYFYHTMELPGHGVMNGDWDLRPRVDDYLGKVVFAGKRVLEIGPASGFLTFEMEKRGAEVASVEVTAEHGWDFVPYPASKLDEVFGPRRIVMERLKNSYWFGHAAQHSKARVYYGDVYKLPAALGEDRGVGLAGREKQDRASILLVPEDLLVRLEIAPRAAPGQNTPCLGREAAKNFNAIQRIVASFHDANRLPRPTL